jgi:NAD(P)-dependent dehydrogenase (short-subunit alcohol dehydrogenase family)
VLPYIIRQGKGAVVLNDSDQWFVGKPASFVYGMTKGAIGQITRSLASFCTGGHYLCDGGLVCK